MANNGNDNGKGPVAAYVSYVTFRNFLKALGEHPLPNRIDSSLMSTLSGSTQSQMMTALRFFGLIDPNGNRHEVLARVVEAAGDDEAWKNAGRDILLQHYEPIVSGIDIKRATQAELDQAFRKYGAEGSVLTKAVRFYLKLVEDAGVEYSGHLRRTRRRASSGTRRQPRKRRTAQQNGEQTPPPADGMIDIPLYFRGRQQGLLRVPPDFGAKENDVQVIDAAVGMAKVYAQQQEGGSDE